MIKSILIHEYQHKSTRVNTNKHDSTQDRHESARVNTTKVIFNGQTSSWEVIKSGVPQESTLSLLMFLIYMNVLLDNIQSTCKIFADDLSLFSHVSDKSTSQGELNKDFQAISNWVFQRKMQFNPDPNKQTQEVYFSKKTNNKVSSHPVSFNNTKVVTCSSQKDLGLVLLQQLNFNDHIQSD